MRYRLDANGYVESVFWGCYSNGCAEYTGTIPYGYTDLNDWSENALINAYYIENGNLVLDTTRLKELEAKIEQDSIDNEPLLRKDLYGTSDVLDSQYQNETAKGNVLVLTNVKKINPKVKITNIDCYKSSKVDIVTQGKNMLKNDAITETISGVTFTKLINGAIKINGTATANIEYNLSGSSNNTASLFALKKNINYYLNIGGLDCELKYYDGTNHQVYTGGSGVINLSESKEVTQVLIKIPSGTTLNETIYPMLECGSSASAYEEYKHRILTIDFNELVGEGLFPSDDLFPSDNLFPKGTTIDYISIEDSKVYVSANGIQTYLMKANVNLFDGYNIVYTMQDTTIEMTYCINELAVDDLGFLQGKATTTNKFRVLEDGSIEAHNGYFSGSIDTPNFKVAEDGSVSITGGSDIHLADDDKSSSIIAITNDNGNYALLNSAHLGFGNINNNNFSNHLADLISFGDGVNLSHLTKEGLMFTENNTENGASISIGGVYLTDGTNETAIGSSGIATPTLIQTSLAKQKKNFEKFENALPVLDEIDIYKYNLNFEEDNHKKHIGFVIGENYNYSSEITAVDKEGKEIGVDNYSMTSLCLQAIKELSNKVKTLEDKIKELESDK